MTARDYLERIQTQEMAIDSKLNRLQELREMVTNPCSHISGLPRSPSPNQQAIHSVVTMIIDLEREIDAEVDALIDAKNDANAKLTQLENPEHTTVLESRYLLGKAWSDIIRQMQRCNSYVYQLHTEALKELEIYLNDGRSAI